MAVSESSFSRTLGSPEGLNGSSRRAVAAGRAQGSPDRPPAAARRRPAPRLDLTVSFPAANTVRFSSATLFKDSHGPFARAFFTRAFRAAGVVQVAIDAEQRTGEIVLDGPLR